MKIVHKLKSYKTLGLTLHTPSDPTVTAFYYTEQMKT